MKSISTSCLRPNDRVSQLRQHHGGFGLVELLVVMAVIGVIAGLAFPAVAGVMAAGRHTKANRQAQTIADTYAAALAAGAQFVVPTREGVVDALTQPGGVRGRGIFSDIVFAVAMDSMERNEARSSGALVEQMLPDGTLQLDFRPQGGP